MNNAITIGFTGTRLGMSREQLNEFRRLIRMHAERHKIERFVHGGAIGADEQADLIACELGIPIDVRPGTEDRQLYWTNRTNFDNVIRITYPARYPLDRNHKIVDSVTEMFATPAETTEKLRSGTWATIRYARKCKDIRKLTIIFPNGLLRQETRDTTP